MNDSQRMNRMSSLTLLPKQLNVVRWGRAGETDLIHLVECAHSDGSDAEERQILKLCDSQLLSLEEDKGPARGRVHIQKQNLQYLQSAGLSSKSIYTDISESA